MPNDNRGPFAIESEYQGKPTLTLKWRMDSEHPFSFGVTKARLILAMLEEIKEFAAKYPDEGRGAMGRGRPGGYQRPSPAPQQRAQPGAREVKAATADSPPEFGEAP